MGKVQFKIKDIEIERSDLDELKKSPKGVKLDISFSISIGVLSKDKNIIKITPSLSIISSDKEISNITVSTFYEIDKKYWDENISDNGEYITIPKNMIQKLTDISLGNIRGVLYTNSYDKENDRAIIIPYVDTARLNKKDLVLYFEVDKKPNKNQEKK